MIPFGCHACGARTWGRLYRGTGPAPEVNYRCTDLSPRLPSDLLRCRACGLLRLAAFPMPEEVERPYVEMEDPEYLEDAGDRAATFDRYLDRLETVCRPGRLLDVGCHVGLLLDRACRRGWRVEGIEPSRWGAAQARARGLEGVRSGTIETVDFADGAFDAVTMMDVVEHLTDPAAAFRRIRRWLRPGGVLLVGTPDGGSLWRRVLGPKWWCIREAHLFYFSRRALALLLRSTGLHPAWFGTQGRYIAPGRLLRLLARFYAGRTSPAAPPGAASFRLWIDPGDQILALARKSREETAP